jgi:magnesium transporter
MGATTIRTCDGGGVTVVGHDVNVVSDLFADKQTTIWIDLQQPERGDLEMLAEELDLHLLAIEDALDEHQRDKLVHYEDHVYLVSHAVSLTRERCALDVAEVDAFIGERWLITVHDQAGHVIDRAVRRWERSRDLAAGGVGSLLYALLDVIVDDYYRVLDQFDQYYDEVSDRLFSDRPLEPAEQREWFEMRRALTRFDRIATPLSDGMGSLVTRDLDRFAAAAGPYLRDVEVEISRVTAEVDVLRELVTQIAEVNMGLRDYRQNIVMKKVTSWAAIIAVPTLITGFYGMNVPYPGSGEPWGVVTASALSLSCSGGLYLLFRRKGWV